jgi:hypothetical protein
MTRRSYGNGSVEWRGEGTYRLRYRVDGKSYQKTFHGSLSDARKELRALLRSGDTGEHVAPAKITVAAWLDQWIKAGGARPAKKARQPKNAGALRTALALSRHPKAGGSPTPRPAGARDRRPVQ